MNVYVSRLTFRNKALRFFWRICWLLFAKPFPSKTCNFWKIFLVRLFGGKIGYKSVIYSSADIYQPWRLKMGSNSCIGSNAIIYNVDDVVVGKNVTISQGSIICTASHDYNSKNFELTTKPVFIEDNVWVASYAFVNLGVRLHSGAVIAAKACVYKDVFEYDVVGGNPAKFIKKRTLKV